MSGAVLSALKHAGRNVKAEFEKTTSTWEHKPQFYIDIGYRGADARMLAWTGDYIWNLLDRGTLVRYSVPVENFQAKSVPRWIGSKQGAGKMVGSSKPLKGIEAREWTEVIAEEQEKVFNQLIVAAIFKGFQ